MTDYELYIRYVRGYNRQVDIKGTPGMTELAMYTGYTDKTGVYALLKTYSDNYAYVKFEDGSFLDGSFILHADGSFTLS